MFCHRAAAVLSILAFVAGGWLPVALHGPAVVHDLHTQCSHDHAAAATSSCGHDHAGHSHAGHSHAGHSHAAASDSAANEMPAGEHGCVVCDLLATAAAPPVAPVRPVRCESVTAVAAASLPAVAFVVAAPHPARGPPAA